MSCQSIEAAALSTQGYAICTSPRSGSNFLCQLLSSTGQLGHPLEYFNGPSRRVLGIPDYPLDPRDQIDFILTKGRTANGIYGVKLFAYQHLAISGSLDWLSALPGLRLVRLVRSDRLGQALSWARALQTQQYRSTQAIQAAPTFDASLIRRLMSDLEKEHQVWTALFARRGENPIEIVYEELVEDPQRAINRVASLFSLPPPEFDPSQIDLSVQRDPTTDEWRRRFLRRA